jgi:hypothetical protein
MSFKTLVIPADPGEPCREETVSSAADINRLVGGFFQIVYHPTRDDVAMYCNEEAKSEDPRLNERATAIVRPILQPSDWIAGDVIFFGFSPADPDEHDVPEDFVKELLP